MSYCAERSANLPGEGQRLVEDARLMNIYANYVIQVSKGFRTPGSSTRERQGTGREVEGEEQESTKEIQAATKGHYPF